MGDRVVSEVKPGLQANKAPRGVTKEKVLERLRETGGNVFKTANDLGVRRSTVYWHLSHGGERNKGANRPIAAGRIKPTRVPSVKLHAEGVKRFICTSAQNNTHLHEKLWTNLLALSEHYDAELVIASYTYNKNAYGEMAVKKGTWEGEETELWYDERLLPYLERWDNKNVELAPGLVWCGRANTLPTASHPLTGFETYTQQKSGIFPHAKIAMVTIPTGKNDPPKFNYTTGTVTQRNYIQKRSGLLAEFHHAYGALLVEVDAKGHWFTRQINASDDGTLCDLDLIVKNGKVESDNNVTAITWGDIHSPNIDPVVRELAWGQGGILDTLKPKYQFLHDLNDFRARNHHDRKDPHKKFKMWVNNQERVEDEIQLASDFLHECCRQWCQTIAVCSNHDRALLRWMKEAEWREDPANAEFFMEAQAAILKAIRAGKEFNALEWALRRAGCPKKIRFLQLDESFVVHGIEQGNHGDLGPNGARGTPTNFRKMGRRMNIGDKHSAGIYDGLYVAGLVGTLDQGYNVGPSSWSHSFIITYQTGKRAIVTIRDGKWRAA